ncbi:hypothetical protein, partial [Acetobacter nitrogenifigens]
TSGMRKRLKQRSAFAASSGFDSGISGSSDWPARRRASQSYLLKFITRLSKAIFLQNQFILKTGQEFGHHSMKRDENSNSFRRENIETLETYANDERKRLLNDVFVNSRSSILIAACVALSIKLDIVTNFLQFYIKEHNKISELGIVTLIFIYMIFLSLGVIFSFLSISFPKLKTVEKFSPEQFLVEQLDKGTQNPADLREALTREIIRVNEITRKASLGIRSLDRVAVICLYISAVSLIIGLAGIGTASVTHSRGAS